MLSARVKTQRGGRAGAPVSHLPGVRLAVFLLLLAPELVQGQSNYLLSHEAWRAAREELYSVRGSLFVAARVAGAMQTTTGNIAIKAASSRALSLR